jgi:hypothetical protein
MGTKSWGYVQIIKYEDTRKNILTCIPIAKQRLPKHIPAEANVRNNRTSIVRQRRGKHASSTIQAAFSLRSVPRGYEGTKKIA